MPITLQGHVSGIPNPGWKPLSVMFHQDRVPQTQRLFGSNPLPPKVRIHVLGGAGWGGPDSGGAVGRCQSGYPVERSGN